MDLLNQEQELDEVSFIYVCGVACRHGLLTEGYSSEEFVQEIEVYVTFTILSRTLMPLTNFVDRTLLVETCEYCEELLQTSLGHE